MNRIIWFLIPIVVISVVSAEDRIGKYRYQSITLETFQNRKHDLLLLGVQIPHPFEDAIVIIYPVGQSAVYTITLETHLAHPSILKETTISDSESDRSWEIGEVWSATEQKIVKEWLLNREQNINDK